MDSSFKLLSSMTPLINKTRRNIQHKRVPTLLSLKKNVRRSTLCDNLCSTQAISGLELIEGSTTDTTESASSYRGLKIMNNTPIVISDSDTSILNNTPINNDISYFPPKDNTDIDVLSKSKYNAINEWLVKVNSEIQNARLSSESNAQINGSDDFHKNRNEFYNFNEMLGSLNTEIKKPSGSHISKTVNFNRTLSLGSSKDSTSESSLIKPSYKKPLKDQQHSKKVDNLNSKGNRYKIDEVSAIKKGNRSLGSSKDSNSESSLIKPSYRKTLKDQPHSKKVDNLNSKGNRCKIDEASAIKKGVIDSDSSSCSSDEHKLGENLLDELYGSKWRDSRNAILTKSEPRRNKNVNLEKLLKTEVKTKSKFTYKNPYLDSQLPTQSSTGKLPTSSKTVSESPWVRRLQSLCDSDSSEESINNIIRKYTKETRTRLSFSDDGDKNENYNSKSSVLKVFNEYATSTSTSTYVSCTENLNVPDIVISSSSDEENHVPLEDRLKKKLVLDKKIKYRLPVIKKTESVDKGNLKDKKKNVKTVNRNIFEEKGADVPEKIKNKTFEKTNKDVEWKTHKSVLQSTVITKDVYVASTISVSFLASLSKTVRLSQCDPAARIFRNNFKLYKSELTTRLFKLYNEKIFDNGIPDDSPLEWNDRMRGTAGYCYCKKIIRRTGLVERKIRIVLSTKVLDSADRLRDTLIHEMCHAATWIVNEVANGHGQYWKAWAHKARQIFPELPPIKRCHDYVINTKYTYKCIDCGYSIGRHTKSLDIEKKRCGYCYGKFEVLINKVSKDGEAKSVPVTPRKAPSAFALFVKENYATFKTPQLNHGQVMKLLGQKFSELKVAGIQD